MPIPLILAALGAVGGAAAKGNKEVSPSEAGRILRKQKGKKKAKTARKKRSK
jgi:hypothetical protein